MPHLVFLVAICIILAGCSGSTGAEVESSQLEEPINAVEDTTATMKSVKMNEVKTIAEARGMTIGDMEKVAGTMDMTLEEMMDMGESMDMTMEEMVNVAESIHMKNAMLMDGSIESGQNAEPIQYADSIQYKELDKKIRSEQQEDTQPTIDPANPPKIATSNFIDLDPYIRITKIRAAYGHNYNHGTVEHDPTGASCSSMKHYFDAYTEKQRSHHIFGSYDTSGVVKYYSPVDGNLYQTIPREIEQGTEYQFYISPTGYKQLVFTFHHVDLLEEFTKGGSVTSGQHIGYIIRPHGQGEIAVSVSNGAVYEYISFFDVMTDEVFAEYQARGIINRAQMTISREEREANPIPCTLNDGLGGKFYSETEDAETFGGWQIGPDNWVELAQ